MRLVLKPASAHPGTSVGMAVANGSQRQVLYGLATSVQRRVDGRWVNANKAVYGEANPRFPLVGFGVKPGETAGPQHGQLRDALDLPPSLAAGRYRVSKRISVGAGDRSIAAILVVD